MEGEAREEVQRENPLKRHQEDLGMSSPKAGRMEVERREEVRKEGTRREDESREEGGQGGSELAPPGQSRSLPACPPGLAGCNLEEELEELPRLETTMDEEDEVEQEEEKRHKETQVKQMMRELVEEVVGAAVPRSSPAKRHQGEELGTYSPKVPRMEVEREESRKRKREEERREVSLGVSHSLDEVVARLEGMEKGEVLGLTNRTVLDMLSAHRPQVDEPFIRVLWRALEVHSSWWDRQLRHRFRYYLVQSLMDRRAELEDSLDEQWLYVGRWLPGGDLHRRELFLPRQKESLARLLVSLGDLVAGERRCHKCGEEGEIPVCSCLTVFFCGEDCQQADGEHMAVCLDLEEERKVGAILANSRTLHHQNRANQEVRWKEEEKRKRKKAEEEGKKVRRKMVALEKIVLRQANHLEGLRKEKREGFQRTLTTSSAAARKGRKTVSLEVGQGQEVYKTTNISTGRLKVLEAVKV